MEKTGNTSKVKCRPTTAYNVSNACTIKQSAAYCGILLELQQWVNVVLRMLSAWGGALCILANTYLFILN